MEIEQLKLVLETLKGASDSALCFGIIYLAKDFVLSIAALIVIPVTIYKAISAIIYANTGSSDKAIADHLGICSPYLSEERRRILAVAQKGIAADAASKSAP